MLRFSTVQRRSMNRATVSVSQAAEIAGVTRHTMYSFLRRDARMRSSMRVRIAEALARAGVEVVAPWGQAEP